MSSAADVQQRICVCTVGSFGDAWIYLQLARELRERGHTVMLLTHSTFKNVVIEKGDGVQFGNIGASVMDLVAEKLANANSAAFSTLQLLHRQTDTMGQLALDWLRTSKLTPEAFKPTFMVLAPATQVTHTSLAELFQIPYCITSYFPNALTGEHGPAIGSTGQVWFAVSAKVRWVFSALYWWHGLYKHPVNSARAALGLPPLTNSCGYWEYMAADKVLNLGLYSPTILPKPADVGEY